MSSVSFMDKLLDGLTVEWRPLGEVGEFVRGKRFVKADILSDGIPCIHYGEMYTYFGVAADKAKSFLDAELTSNLRFANHGDVIIVAAGENIEDIGNGTAWIGKDDVVIHDACFAYKSRLNPVYVSYFLRTKSFKDQIKKHVSSGKISSINSNGLSKAIIPIPCPENAKKSLEVQTEIVRILDNFAELAAELAVELATRKKQYNYYRDHLLSVNGMEGEVEWKALGDIGEFIRGKRFTKADYVEEGVSVIHYGEIYTRYGAWADHTFSKVRAEMAGSLRYAEPGDVVLTDVGETVAEVGKAVAWLGDERVAIHDHCYAFRHSMNPKFVSYCMQTKSFIAKKAKHVARTKVNTLLMNGFSKVEIPVPFPRDPERSLAEQARIVAILDKFDVLTNSISEGLPREIALRQKQYEHYRDLLLGFPKPVGGAA